MTNQIRNLSQLIELEIRKTLLNLDTTELPYNLYGQYQHRLEELKKMQELLNILGVPIKSNDAFIPRVKYAQLGESEMFMYTSSDNPVLYRSCPAHEYETLPILLVDKKVRDSPSGNDLSATSAVIICPTDLKLYVLQEKVYDS